MKKYNSLLLIMLAGILVLMSCSRNEELRNNTGAIHTPPPGPSVPPVSRTMINTQLLPVGTLSQIRSEMAVASAGNKIVFAGGLISAPNVYSSRVDIFDITTNTWGTAELSQARTGIATATWDKKIYFAGGLFLNGTHSSRVDIYNTETNVWTTAELPNGNQYLTGAAANNKVVFAGGAEANILDVFTNTWTIAPLSEKAGEGYCCQGVVEGITSSVIGNTIYFAGGLGFEVHKEIDIYNSANNTWSTSQLSEYKGYVAGIAVGNTNYWAGGYTYLPGIYTLSDLVEIRDMNSGRSTFSSLFQRNANFSAVAKNDTIVFFTGQGAEKNKFDIYDITNNAWLVGVLPYTVESASITSVNNTIYVAGGVVNGAYPNKLWKLEF